MPPPLDNNGKQMVTQLGGGQHDDPKGAKDIEWRRSFRNT